MEVFLIINQILYRIADGNYLKKKQCYTPLKAIIYFIKHFINKIYKIYLKKMIYKNGGKKYFGLKKMI